MSPTAEAGLPPPLHHMAAPLTIVYHSALSQPVRKILLARVTYTKSSSTLSYLLHVIYSAPLTFHVHPVPFQAIRPSHTMTIQSLNIFNGAL
ncbi:hypothetical protein SK128_026339, partial [Halocaridina rubra]